MLSRLILVVSLLQIAVPALSSPRVVPGADRLLSEEFRLVKGKRVGIITNSSGRLSNGVFLVDTLLARGVRVAVLFGPEHGIRGEAAAGAKVVDSRDPKTGIRVYSLYGEHTKPSKAMLRGVDVLVYDIQDVGVRFYTYLSTMTLAMEAAAEYKIPFVVCDRPNPLGGQVVDGPIREDSLRSFVGWLPVPVVYGLTCGELARMINGEGWLAKGLHADLHVVAMKGWTRTMLWEDTGLPWNPPSPNIRTPETALVYPATCYVEAMNVSEGRGTDRPFETIGAPKLDGARLWSDLAGLDLPGVRFRPAQFTPSSSKYAGELCSGVDISVTDPRKVDPLGLALYLIRGLLNVGYSPLTIRESWMSRLMGTPAVLQELRKGADPVNLRRGWGADLERFRQNSTKYLLYSS